MTKPKRILTFWVTLLLLLSGIIGSSAAVLAWGSRGEQVRLVQQRLKEYGYLSGSVDGIFGQETYNAVLWFQRKNGLTVDGRVGSATAAALGISLTGGALSAGLYQESELTLLARLVNGEARGEPYIGQVAVAAVVLNRVDHPSFPNTMAGVIYQKGAFSCLDDGQFDQPIADSAYQAARDALNGADPSGGAIYYFNPATATSKWIWSRPHLLTIGKHRFCA